MEIRRGLLAQGNLKLGDGSSIHHFDLPSGRGRGGSCPGAGPTCLRECYAARGNFRFPHVRDRLAYNLAVAKRPEFVHRLGHELWVKGVFVMRWFVSGDIFSPGFGRKMIAVMRAAPRVRFFAYTRSYRLASFAEVLEEMAALPNLSLWFSADADGFPARVPDGVRVAWLSTRQGDEPEGCDLVFRVRRLRRQPLPLAPVCPQEVPGAREAGVSCANCRLCID